MLILKAIKTIPFLGMIALAYPTQFEKLSVSQTLDSTTVTLRAFIPTGYVQPKLTDCTTVGTTLNCRMKAQKPESGISQISSPVPHILSVTLPQRTDIWQVNIYYRGKTFKTKG